MHDSVNEQVTWVSNNVICLLYLENMCCMFKTITITQHHIPEDNILPSDCYENLNSTTNPTWANICLALWVNVASRNVGR